MNNQDLLYTVEETAKILKINKNAAYELINSKQLLSMKLGRIKVPRWALLKFVKDNIGKDLTDPREVKEMS